MSIPFKSTVLFLMSSLLCAPLWAQTPNAPSEAPHSLDTSLVGVWEGEFPPVSNEANCVPYHWRMERRADGTYHYVAYDNTQTLLKDDGRWWVNKSGEYFENVSGQPDEPIMYRYIVSQNNLNGSTPSIEFKQLTPLQADECRQSAVFNENRTAS